MIEDPPRPTVELKTHGPADAVQSITWNFRGELFTVPTRGTAAEVRQEFQTTPLRALIGDVVGRQPAPGGWMVEALEMREAPGVVRLVVVGAGVGCILFEGLRVPDNLADWRRLSVGFRIDDVLKATGSSRRLG